MRKQSIAIMVSIIAVCTIIPASIGLNLIFFNNPSGTPTGDISSTFTLTTDTNQTSPTKGSQDSSADVEVVGHAYDRQNRKSLGVVILASGNIEGNIEKNLKISVRGGDIKVGSYGSFSIVDGSATLHKSGVVTFELTLAEHYGGQPIKWVLNCEVINIEQKTYTILLTADSLMLPIDGYPTIENLSIMCTIKVH